MLQALLYGGLASSALLLGALLGARWRAPSTITGVLLAFASGSLIAALAFELFPEAAELGGLWPAGAALLLGGASFTVLNSAIDAYVAGEAGPQLDQQAMQREGAGNGLGWALVAAVTLDGVPENLALGVSLNASASLALLVAIFVSNFPEALVGALAMREGGSSTRRVIGIWGATGVLLVLAVVLGQLLGALDPLVLALLMAFAGGAVLASLADTLMPEAFEKGRPWNAFATALGFLLSFTLSG